MAVKASLLTLALLFGPFAAGAWADTLVVPRANANTAGNAVICVPLNLVCDATTQMRMQQLYPASEFAGVAGPITITQIAFRLAQGQPSYAPTTVPIKITASTTSAPGVLSATFAANVGADALVVVNGNVVTSSQGTYGGAQVAPFDIVVPFQKSFVYDPSKGNLLLDFVVTTGVGGGELDAVDYGGLLARVRVFDDATTPSGLLSSKSIITQFTYASSTSAQLAGVRNAASFSTGAAPGEIVTIFGTNLPANPAVTFDGRNAPVLYAGTSQINTVVPFGVSGASTTLAVGSLPALVVPVVPAAPGFFTADGSGSGQLAALNQDGSVNTAANPAKAGTVVSVFLTGIGTLSPAIADGQLGPLSAPFPAPTISTSATVNGFAAPILFIGQAPGLIAGAIQANIQIPTGTATGNAALIIYAGNYRTQLNATTIAVQ